MSTHALCEGDLCPEDREELERFGQLLERLANTGEHPLVAYAHVYDAPFEDWSAPPISEGEGTP